MTIIHAPGRTATYPVHVGPLDLSGLDGDRPVACISDPHVWDLHGRAIAAQVACDVHLVPRGEPAKCWDELQRLIAFLAARNHQRSDPVLAFGGGSVGDLAGLAAALYRRGCPVVQVPTTLLAQVDSSVGGKTAIDSEGQKNIVGAFHPPVAVHADPAFLDTLPVGERRAGLAETIKYGLIGDREFYGWLIAQGGAGLLAGDADIAARAIATAVRAKADLVAGDLEDRSGRRALLNLGHSFGHAIESLAGLGAVLHGEAVAIGMTLAAHFSARQGMIDDAVARQVDRDLDALGLPTRLANAGLDGRGADLLPAIRHDKKNEEGRLTLILLEGIGAARVVRDVDEEALAAFLVTL